MRNRWIPAIFATMLLLAAVATGCSSGKSSTPPETPASPTSPATMTADQMDKMMEAGIKSFPAKTEGVGNQVLAPVMDGSVKVFHLTVSKVMWEATPGNKVEAFAYNGQIPGPTIHVTEGDKFRVVVKNELPESTAVHWHGLLVANSQDGVPFITQDPIKPGATFTYDLTAANPGTQFYHSHMDTTAQVSKGLYGGLIVDPKDPVAKAQYKENQDVTMFLSEGPMGLTINGKGFPATSPIVAKLGDKVRLRYINAGQMVHTMHLHGLTQLVVEKDGYALPAPYRADTILIGPGERYDVIVDANNPGTWALHCHVLSHAENETGMLGMVTVFAVKP